MKISLGELILLVQPYEGGQLRVVNERDDSMLVQGRFVRHASRTYPKSIRFSLEIASEEGGYLRVVQFSVEEVRGHEGERGRLILLVPTNFPNYAKVVFERRFLA